jgi:hypothetical protein
MLTDYYVLVAQNVWLETGIYLRSPISLFDGLRVVQPRGQLDDKPKSGSVNHLITLTHRIADGIRSTALLRLRRTYQTRGIMVRLRGCDRPLGRKVMARCSLRKGLKILAPHKLRLR